MLMLLCGAVGFLPRPALAVPSNQKVWTFTQPDGTKFQAILRGDEFYAYHQTPAGSIILQDPKNGFWHHAIPQADGSLKATTAVVGKSSLKTATLNKDLIPWLKSVEKTADARAQAMTSNFQKGARKVSPRGTVKGVMLLANFSDTTATFSAATFNDLMNAPGYGANGAMGSVRDYYLEASYGQLTLQTDVHGWFTLPRTMAYYGANLNGEPGNDANPRQMVIDAINASNATVNYANYDADGDGRVDFFGVIHQGQGEEQGGTSPDCIWSHRWSLSSPMTVDGKTIQDYHTEPEKLYAGLTTIGVICHETGHFFGLPDLYDTSYASEGIGDWSIMASGSWCGPGGNGAKPSHFDPWCKMILNWVTPTLVATAQSGVALPAWDQNPAALMIPIDPYADGEYFLVCNRYRRTGASPGTGFDRYLPGSGALVMHINDDAVGNDNFARKQVDVEEADGLAELDLALNRGDAGDLYPNGGAEFSDTSDPNSEDDMGNATGIILNNFTGGGSAMMTVDVAPGEGAKGTAIIYDANGNLTGLGYGDGSDYGCVRFTSATGGTLKRIKPYFVYSGTTSYIVSIYGGWNAGAPTGLLASQTGTHSGVGFGEIELNTPLTIAAGSDFYVVVRFNTGRAYAWPLPLGLDVQPDGRSYISNSGSTYASLNDLGYGDYDLDIRADLTPPAPSVTSITRADASPTNAGLVSFLVAFSQAVNGGSAGNFSLTTSGGIVGAFITGVSGSGSQRTVTVNTGSGGGTLRLDLASGAGLADIYGQVVTGAGEGSGAIYSIDKTAPAIVEQTPGRGGVISGLETVRVTFGEAVSGVAAGGLKVNGSAATNVVGSGAGPWTFSGFAAPADGTVNVALTAGGIKDAAGNAFAGDAWTLAKDSTPPLVALSSADVANEGAINHAPAFTATFNQDVTGFAAEDMDVANGVVSGFTGSGKVYTFTVKPAADGLTSVTVKAGAAHAAAAPFNASAASAPYAFTYDTVAPQSRVTAPANDAVLTMATFTLAWTSGDAGGSGVKNVMLVWKKDNLSPAAVAGGPFGPGTSSVKFSGPGSGWYSLYSIATDRAGNEEAAPTTYDVRFQVFIPSAAGPGWGRYR